MLWYRILVWIVMHYRNANYLGKLLPVSIVNNDDHDDHDNHHPIKQAVKHPVTYKAPISLMSFLNVIQHGLVERAARLARPRHVKRPAVMRCQAGCRGTMRGQPLHHLRLVVPAFSGEYQGAGVEPRECGTTQIKPLSPGASAALL